jgi:hypothetical protein
MMSNALRFHLRRYGVLQIALRHPKLFAKGLGDSPTRRRHREKPRAQRSVPAESNTGAQKALIPGIG